MVVVVVVVVGGEVVVVPTVVVELDVVVATVVDAVVVVAVEDTGKYVVTTRTDSTVCNSTQSPLWISHLEFRGCKMPTMSEKITVIEEAANETDAELVTLRQQRQTIDELIAELERQARGLRGYLARHNGSEPPPDETAPELPWLKMTRGEAIITAMKMLTPPASPKQIQEIFNANGRDDDGGSISRRLQDMKREGRAHSPRWGKWSLGPEPEISEPDEPNSQFGVGGNGDAAGEGSS